METKNYVDQIMRIFDSQQYEKCLKEDLQNFPNQKLESHSRNNLVKIFNSKEEKKEERAFAEHPRYGFQKNEKNKRIQVDFSICTMKEVKFTMEIRYHFPNDYSRYRRFDKQIKEYLMKRKYGPEDDDFVDAYLLIICEIEKEKLSDFQEKWNLNDLAQYQPMVRRQEWKEFFVNKNDFLSNELKYTELFNGINKFKNSIEVRSLKKVIKTPDDFEAIFHYHLFYRQ